eukprot:TRINITY_DN681_c0_g1_i1.p1 TRINITY_DN681_c0_g1~~TRINITY_DN681_c0_g1_i1.p1  ORF type:complete len:403 (+),score=51.11 TRINITY_DN681_c0_g1_i1:70-1209(+)
MNQAVCAGEAVYVAACIGLDVATNEYTGPDVESQTRQTLTNLSSILTAAGCTLGDVVKCTVYLADMAEFGLFNGVYASFFPADPPARVTFTPGSLPRSARVMIDCIAVPPVDPAEHRHKRARLEPSVHVKARGPHPSYPPRLPVVDHRVAWSSEFPGYSPLVFTHERVQQRDAADPRSVDYSTRFSYEGPLVFDPVTGAPLNPRGRTGLAGRGVLPRWGPVQCADSIVTRDHPQSPGKLQMVAIQRRDTGVWALPGGKVDPGESFQQAMRREFEEEAGNVGPADTEAQKVVLDQVFADMSHIIHKGYVDDPRNTDNSWMETVAAHFHLSASLAAQLKIQAGDDAQQVKWLDIDNANPEYLHLFASHRDFVETAVRQVKQ